MGRPAGGREGGAVWPGMGTVVRRGLIKHRRRMTAAFPSAGSAESLRTLEAGDDFAIGPDAMWSALYAVDHPAEREFRFTHREANAGRVWEVRGADLVELSPDVLTTTNELRRLPDADHMREDRIEKETN